MELRLGEDVDTQRLRLLELGAGLSRRSPLDKVTAVVLSEGTMDVASALQTLDPRTALINQEGMQHQNYITFMRRGTSFSA